MATKKMPRRPLGLNMVETLAEKLAGTVVLSGDAGYDDALKAWNLAVRHHPAIVARARSASNIAPAVVFSRAADLDMALQAAGHYGRIAAVDPASSAFGTRLARISLQTVGVPPNLEAQSADHDLIDVAGDETGRQLDPARGLHASS